MKSNLKINVAIKDVVIQEQDDETVEDGSSRVNIDFDGLGRNQSVSKRTKTDITYPKHRKMHSLILKKTGE
jgi:hypothetical protein